MKGRIMNEAAAIDTTGFDDAEADRLQPEASMVPDGETAARQVADPVSIAFTGGRVFDHPS